MVDILPLIGEYEGVVRIVVSFSQDARRKGDSVLLGLRSM